MTSGKTPEVSNGPLRCRTRIPRPLAAGGALFLIVTAACLAAPLLTGLNPDSIDLAARLLPPSAKHPLGTDEIGRDLFARLLYGGRYSIGAGSAVVFVGLILGGSIGCIAGFVGGWVELVVTRLADAVMALPGLIIALALTAVLGPSLFNAVISLGILSSPLYLRLARAETLVIKEAGYVVATRLLGGGLWLQLRRNVIPNAFPILAIYASLNLGGAIVAIASLSFIGLGAQPPMPEWGALVNSGRGYLESQWWYATAPGAAIAFVVLSCNLLGDGLRDLLDPRLGRRS